MQRTPSGSPATAARRALVVDDDPIILRGFTRVLTGAGWTVEGAEDGEAAGVLLDETAFDVVLSDIHMPGMSGIDLIRMVRERDLDVPVILVTSDPRLETAIRAVEFGAFRYLTKPVDSTELLDVLTRAARMHEMAKVKREALAIVGSSGHTMGDRASLEARFDNALAKLFMVFQPIVLPDGTVHGYEALMRTEEASLARPPDLLDAAERLDRLRDLGRTVRGRVASCIDGAPADALIFVNLHAADLDDPELSAEDAPLRRFASRVVLEITERASLDHMKGLVETVRHLGTLGYRIAIDDLGAGYAGLTSFVMLEPQVVKLDMSLIRDIDKSPRKQSVVRSLLRLCGAELGLRVVCEGVETKEERDLLVEMGADLFQGYFYAKPAKGFAAPAR